MAEQELGGFWTLIWPDWSTVGDGGVHAAAPVLVVLIWIVAVVACGFAWYQARRARGFADETDVLLEGVTTDTLWQHRAEVLRRSATASTEVADAWREFDETLVSVADERKVWNTVEAEQFFNAARFAPRLLHNRFLDAAPAALTTLGLLGTFLGLTVGLRGLDLGGDSDTLTTGIQTLVAGAGVGFTASLWGVGTSLLVNVLTKYWERRAVRRIERLQSRIDALFTLRSPEQSLIDIARSTHESQAALSELHQKIGDRLQEALVGVAEQTRDAVTQSMENALAPVMQDLASKAANQSAEVFEKVSEQLTSSFHAIGTSLADGLTQSSESMRSTLEYMAEKLAQQADQYREQMAELQSATARQVELLEQSLPRVVESVQEATTRLETGSERLETAAKHLALTSDRFETVSEKFGDVLADSAEAFEEMSAKNTGAANVLESLSGQMVELTTTTVAASATLEASAETLHQGFGTLRAQQNEFLVDLERTLASHSEVIATWLNTYSDEVSKHTGRRMEEWNRHTESFTTTMLTAVQAMSYAVDELNESVEQRRGPEPEAEAA
ncbi:anti-phage ZorAB system protein ZorA [Cellulosimicrobium cellulans]|uniref:anti-phage ZorAB system protein ZorA n=1 Tax=Cellulosimicrobium cellulans TaxID=1710 RepID=UPI0020CF3E72|nr:anti-phage defense ZorAB system protein ZorA [Cellulosimicrobium cellulans]